MRWWFLYTDFSCIMRRRAAGSCRRSHSVIITISSELISVERIGSVTCWTFHPRQSRWRSVLTFGFFLQVYIECTVKTDNMIARLGNNRYTTRRIVHFYMVATVIKWIAAVSATVMLLVWMLLMLMMISPVHCSTNEVSPLTLNAAQLVVLWTSCTFCFHFPFVWMSATFVVLNFSFYISYILSCFVLRLFTFSNQNLLISKPRSSI